MLRRCVWVRAMCQYIGQRTHTYTIKRSRSLMLCHNCHLTHIPTYKIFLPFHTMSREPIFIYSPVDGVVESIYFTQYQHLPIKNRIHNTGVVVEMQLLYWNRNFIRLGGKKWFDS